MTVPRGCLAASPEGPGRQKLPTRTQSIRAFVRARAGWVAALTGGALVGGAVAAFPEAATPIGAAAGVMGVVVPLMRVGGGSEGPRDDRPANDGPGVATGRPDISA